MRCLKRNKRPIYLCQQYEDRGISKYKEPIAMFVNYQSTNSESDLIALGTEFPMYIRIKIDAENAPLFHTGDRVYIGYKPSVNFDVLCKDANFEVDSEPMVSLNMAEVVLKKLSAKQWLLNYLKPELKTP